VFFFRGRKAIVAWLSPLTTMESGRIAEKPASIRALINENDDFY
jgi:hypothetical protein